MSARGPITERDVEHLFVQCGKRRGAFPIKLASPGCAGVPDRLVLLPGGGTALVEIKAPGKRPRPLQRRIFERMAALGHPVEVIDSAGAVAEFWDRVLPL